MKIFIDANILISVLNHEYPLFNYSSRILSLADNPNYQIFTSPICLAIIFYFSEKKSGRKLAKKKLEILCQKVQSTLVNQEIVRSAIMNPKVFDFKDGLEYYSALHSGCEVILTEDKTDFYFSELPVLNSQEFVRKYFGK
ncbi:PIN domain-containing protein [Shivajiella indica]|uniref:PIN domain-containing protein n=1 Tax=Shivajiella indica TaxID=872115 RepID=A0ABW5B3I5_9BACT